MNALIEALSEKIPVNKVYIADGKRDKRVDVVIRLCKENGVVFQMVPQQTISRKAGNDHQGIFAEVSPIRFYELDEIVNSIQTGLILILDSINDTGNLGAIIRSAVAANVDAVVISQRNTAPINETVLKTSSGALLKARIVISKNLSRDFEFLKQHNFWIVGSVMNAERSIPYYDFDFTVNTAIVMGNENKGVSPLLQKNSDQSIYIPQSKRIDSLNVSAASAVLLFEALRQKSVKNKIISNKILAE